MTVPAKTDFVSEGLSYLRQSFASRPNIAATLTAFLQHAQQIEDAARSLNGLYQISAATGAQLDGIASIVGVDRNGLDDETFRLLVYAQIAANHGDATVNTVLSLTGQLFQAEAVFGKTALNAPAAGSQNAFVSLTVLTPKLPAGLFGFVQSLLSKNLGAGVSLSYLAVNAKTDCFRCAGDAASSGFASKDGSVAGAPLSGLLSRLPV